MKNKMSTHVNLTCAQNLFFRVTPVYQNNFKPFPAVMSIGCLDVTPKKSQRLSKSQEHGPHSSSAAPSACRASQTNGRDSMTGIVDEGWAGPPGARDEHSCRDASMQCVFHLRS